MTKKLLSLLLVLALVSTLTLTAFAVETGTEPATEESTDVPEGPIIVGASTFYVVGSFTDWETNDTYILTKNPEAENEYMLSGVSLEAQDQFQVVETNGSIQGFDPVWYPGDVSNNYVIAVDGTYDIYFRPKYDGGNDWFHNCIYVASLNEPATEEPTEPATPDIPDTTGAIAAWVFDAEGKEAGAKLTEYGDSDNGYAATLGAGTLTLSVDGETGRSLEWSDAEYGENEDAIVPIMAAGKKNLWGTSPYIQVQLSTADYEGITFTAYLAGSKKAPANWQLSYSTDGETFTDIEGASFTLSSEKRKILTAYLDGTALPDAADGAETLYLRLTAASTTTVSGGDTADSPSGGEVAINYIMVKGSEPAAESVLLGDVDTDGDVSILDATYIQRWLANLPTASFNTDAADTDGDTEITILDATYIQRWLASLPVDFAIGEPING